MIIFINLVIAILSDTYTSLSEQKLGLFYDSIIEVINEQKYKKYYGALVAAVPPFNLFAFPFLPMFAFTKNKKKLRCLNNTLARVGFLPFACLATVCFAVINLLIAPVAYCITLFRKAKQLHRMSHLLDFLFFLCLGLPMLLLSQAADLVHFFMHIYTFRKDYLPYKRIDGISL